MSVRPTQQLSGGKLLSSIRAELAPYRDQIAPLNKQVAVIRFAAEQTDPGLWQRRMEASRVSAVQKEKAFSQLGYQVDHQVLSGRTSAADFAALIDRHSADPRTSAVIVQYPPPPHLAPLVQRLAPEKDIDGLLGDRSLQQACATADGITRVVRPFAQDDPKIAVVGGQGFVGSGVVRLLQQDGLRVESLDAGDDLRRTRNADIVVSATGNPHVLTDEHIRPHHRLVVDSGFMPQPDGSIAGDIAPSAQQIPQYITPVPGGIGPVEMAVLMDRIVRQEVDPGRDPWSVPQVAYLSRGEMAARSNLAPAAGAVAQQVNQPADGRSNAGRQEPGISRNGGEQSR
ncbi:tetrahydrofolate dehydrogenase/cyclohydrolase catalytic domain-containing protein [Kribbella monticola]|uniref:tetrahydrofolate dehydrogenase/cyclohydrolase catalytic domain-containing protein n=1 Tax=Kribbella monticola TaxID=2185285 RepID=UPI000DD40BC0|nr:bifunctional 5,10-methylenetetrahydrofolate dehydrogenase/5,10-methenyltetrahydrofolate cyclohydrolase [Kribbella monticola]